MCIRDRAGDPGAGELLVVARDDDGPLAVDAAEALDDANAAVLVVPVSYTHLDVYKRQPTSLSGIPA